MNLSTKLVYIIFPLVVVPMLMLGHIASQGRADQSEAFALLQVNHLMEKTKASVEQYVRRASQNVELISSNRLLIEYMSMEDEELRFNLYQQGLLELFKNYNLANPDYYEIRVVFADGYEDTRFSSRHDENFSEDESDSPYFKDIVRSGSEIYANIYRNPDNQELAFVVSKKMHLKSLAEQGHSSKTSHRGYLLVTAKADVLTQEPLSGPFGGSGYLFYSDSTGKIVYHPNKEKIGTFVPSKLFKELISSAFSPNTLATLNEEDVYLYQKKIQRDIYLNAIIPKEVVLGESRALIEAFFLITLCSILVTVLLMFYAVRRIIITPLNRFMFATEEIGKGNLDIDLNFHSNDELGAMGKTIKAMAQQLVNTTVSKEYVDDIIQSMNETLVVIDRDLNIKVVNRATTNLLGYQERELIGRAMDIIIDEGKKEELVALLYDVRGSHGQAINKNVRYLKKSGEAVWVQFSAVFMSGTTPEIVCVAHDLTERYRYELELKSAKDKAEIANQAKSTFLSRMSHELRTPLNAIIGFAQIQEMAHGPKTSAKDRRSTEHILKAGRHLLMLINDIMDMVRIERHEINESLESCALHQILEESFNLVQEQAKRENISIARPHTSYSVIAIEGRLKQVFVNILSNGIKYNREGGSIEVTVELIDNGVVKISFADTGIGIDQNEYDAIFEPFTRLHYAEQSEIQGAGIGLALTKFLVQEMHGEIGVESAVGKGSTFWLKFEQCDQALALDQALPTSQEFLRRPGTTTNVLYIEDNRASIDLLETFFMGRGDVRLLTATTAERGIELACDLAPELILLDINLPSMDGLTALNILRSNKKLDRSRIVALSADALPEQIETALEAGFDFYLTKPINLAQITELIE